VKRPHILLVNPWIYDFAAYNLWAKPMGLLVMATRLRKMGWDPILLDCLDSDHPSVEFVRVKQYGQGKYLRTPIDKPHALKNIPRVYSRYGLPREVVENQLACIDRPSAVFVTSHMTYWYPAVRDTVSLIRDYFPDTPIILGGIYATIIPDHALQICSPDLVVEGPAEHRLAEILYRLTGVGSSVPDGLPDLELSPALDLMNRQRFLPLLTSRGCPYSCNYCASGILTPGMVVRNVDEVVSEIENFIVKYGLSDLALYDDAFLVNPQNHALPILEQVAQRFPGLRWHSPNGLHASLIDMRIAVAMKTAGFESIRLGLESASDKFHHDTGGKTRSTKFLTAVSFLRQAGFRRDQIGAYLLVGLPGQSATHIEKDVEFVIKAGAFPKLAEFSPIPGTLMWEKALQKTRLPIAEEPLFQNCTLLSASEPDVTTDFIAVTRRRIRREISSFRVNSSKEP
jgi:radical SAM superfamily enzyme YgiQ (UPF0313 family)